MDQTVVILFASMGFWFEPWSMAKAWAATADMTPMPPITDKTIPAKFMRVLTIVVVAGDVPLEEAAPEGVPPATALSVDETEDIL